MSEAELHVLRARLNGGIRNKAARGELRRGLPVGFVWGEADGEVLLPSRRGCRRLPSAPSSRASPRPARRAASGYGSARRAHKFPLQMHAHAEIRWVEASYTAIHHVLTNPVYAGAYVYGKTRQEMTLDAAGARKKRIRHLPRAEWQVLIQEHHQGFIDWQTYEANQDRIANNTRPGPHKVGRRREGRRRTAARPRQLRTLRPPSAHALSRTQLLAGLSLLRRASRRGTRQLLPQRRRHPNRRGRGAGLHCRARAGEDRSHAGRCRAAREPIARPRSSNGGSASSGRATRQASPSAAIVPSIPTTGSSRAASSASGRKACARLRQQGASLHAAKRSARACSPRRSAIACSHSDLISRPSGSGNNHAARQEGAAADAARGSHRQGRARQGRSPSHAALERRRARRDRSGAATLAAGHDPHR